MLVFVHFSVWSVRKTFISRYDVYSTNGKGSGCHVEHCFLPPLTFSHPVTDLMRCDDNERLGGEEKF